MTTPNAGKKIWHRSQDGARNVERKPIQPHRLRFSDRGHSITLIQTLCHTFFSKNPPKIAIHLQSSLMTLQNKKSLNKITGLQRETLSNWWLNQPNLKNMLVQLDHLPQGLG